MHPHHRVPLLLCLAAALACASLPPPPSAPVARGNPAGYRVHQLTGASLSARDAEVNGRRVDTTSVESIEASIQAILDSAADAPRTVEEVAGQKPEVTVDFTAPARAVPPVFHGADLQWRSKYFLENPRWLALVGHMKLGILRFPGGQERVRYDRSARRGTVEQDTLVVTKDQPYEFRITGEDVAAFIRFCQAHGIEAEPELNLTVDDPAMWKDLVDQIVHELKYDLKYVSVGNEADVRSPNGNWPYLGAGDGDRRKALASYVDRYLRYHAAISPLVPQATWAYGELGMWTPDQLPANLDLVLGPLGQNRPGAIAAHWYMTGDWGQADSDPSHPGIAHLAAQGTGSKFEIAYLSTIAATMREKAAAHGQAGAKLFLGEWGTSWSATPVDAETSDRLAAALFNAEAQERGKLIGFESMQWFGLADPDSFSPWVPSLIEVADADGRPRPRPQWYVYLLYRHLYGDAAVPVVNGYHDDWSIHAARDAAGRSYLMLVNRSPTRPYTPVVQVRTTAGERQLRLTVHPRSVTVVSF